MGGSFIQNADTQRFKDDYDKLWRVRAFKTQAEVSRAIKYDRASLNQVLNGKRDLPNFQISLFYEKYKSTHLLENTTPEENKTKPNQTDEAMKHQNELLKKENQSLKREMVLMNEMMELLRSQLGIKTKARTSKS